MYIYTYIGAKTGAYDARSAASAALGSTFPLSLSARALSPSFSLSLSLYVCIASPSLHGP